MKSPLSRSLSIRLLAIFAATAVVILALLVTTFSFGLGSQWRHSLRPHISQYLRYIEADLGNPPAVERARELAASLPVAISLLEGQTLRYSNDPDVESLQALDYHALRPRHHHRTDKHLPAAGAGEPMSGRLALADRQGRRHRRDAVLRIRHGEHTVYLRLLNLGLRRGAHGDALWFALGLIGLILLGCYYLIRRQLAPIRKIQQAVALMASGDLRARARVSGHDDLAELANSTDAMAARLQQMLDAKRQLLLALSHELRSPLARARVATALLEPGRHRERLERDLGEMERLIDDIMESERLQQHTALTRQSIDLMPLIRKTVDSIDFDVEIVDPIGTDASLNVPVYVDPIRVEIVLRNLLHNALEHGIGDRTDGRIVLRTEQDGQSLILAVEDNGKGIPRAYLERVSEAFFRGDESRTRQRGGFGMGLTLAELIVQAHGGRLVIDSPLEHTSGTRVSAIFPQAFVNAPVD